MVVGTRRWGKHDGVAALSKAAPDGIVIGGHGECQGAFEFTVADPSFLADMARAGLDVMPLAGDKMATPIAQTMATPASVVERARALLKGE